MWQKVRLIFLYDLNLNDDHKTSNFVPKKAFYLDCLCRGSMISFQVSAYGLMGL